jgi:hypothetical protein
VRDVAPTRGSTPRHVRAGERSGARRAPTVRQGALLPLQRSVGNRAVTALVQRQDETRAPRRPENAPPNLDPTSLPLEPLLLRMFDDIPNLSTLLRLGSLERPAGPPWQDKLSQPRPGEEHPARPGSAGDLAAAVAGMPEVDMALESAKAAALRDWRGLSAGEKWLVGATGAVIAAPLLTQGDIRTALDGLTVPKPASGSPWVDNVDIVLHTRGNGVGVGLQIDLAGLLRSRGGGGVLGGSVARTAGVVQRDAADAPKHEPSLAAAELSRLARATTPTKVPMPVGMHGRQAWAIDVQVDAAARLLYLAGGTPPRTEGRPEVHSVTVIYTNDGRGPFPNIGGGADQEMTASVHVRFNFSNEKTGWTAAGYNFEIWTPLKGGSPVPLPGDAPGVYPGQPGPETGGYKGLVYADFAYRISGTGARDLTVLTKLGANSTWLGDQAQSNWVHEPLGIAKFDWKQEPTEPYAALGLRAQSILDLVADESVTDSEFRMRLTLSSQASAGTHDVEAGGGATLSMRSGLIRLGGLGRAAVELRFGADGRGLARYNDQGGLRAGLEVGVSNEVRLHLRDVDLPWVPEFDAMVFAGGRSQQSTLPEGRAPAGEDRPGATGAWLGPGSKTQGWIGVEIPLR